MLTAASPSADKIGRQSEKPHLGQTTKEALSGRGLEPRCRRGVTDMTPERHRQPHVDIKQMHLRESKSRRFGRSLSGCQVDRRNRRSAIGPDAASSPLECSAYFATTPPPVRL